MRNVTVVCCIILVFMCQQGNAQPRWAASLNAGIIVPVGKLGDSYSMGYDAGLKLLRTTKNENVSVVVGLLYSYYPNKNDDSDSDGYASIQKLYIGPQLSTGSIKNVYFLPSVAGNLSGGSTRFGVDFIIGLKIPVNPTSYLDVSLTYELQNLIGKEEGESNVSAMHFLIGFGKKF